MLITSIGFGHNIPNCIVTISDQFINNIVEGCFFLSFLLDNYLLVLSVIYCKTYFLFYVVKTMLSLYNWYCNYNWQNEINFEFVEEKVKKWKCIVNCVLTTSEWSGWVVKRMEAKRATLSQATAPQTALNTNSERQHTPM